MLTKNLRTHQVLLGENEIINITKQQADVLNDELKIKKANDFIIIYDLDTKKELFNWKKSEIKRIIEKEYSWEYSGVRFICDYWTRHSINEDCKCKQRFWCFPWSFQYWLEQRGHKIIYENDITKAMQQEYLSWKEKNKIKWYDKTGIEYYK